MGLTAVILNLAGCLPVGLILLIIHWRQIAGYTQQLIDDKRRQLDGILQKCLGLSVTTTVPEPEVAPGESVKLLHGATVRSSFPVRSLAIRYPSLKTEIPGTAALKVDGAAVHVMPHTITIPASTAPTQPYWLREASAAGIFRVEDSKLIGRPENPPTFPVEFVFEVG